MIDHAAAELLRTTLEQCLTTTEAARVPAALSELGWADVVADDAASAWSILFEVQGRALSATPALDLLVLGACGKGALDPSTTAVGYPEHGRSPARREGDEVRLHAIALAGLERATTVLVPLDGTVVVVPAGAELVREVVHGMDASLGLTRLSGVATPVEVFDVDWATATRTAGLAVGHELVGNATRMLDIAVEHVLGRKQFGVAIGSFQAVKHRLADVHVAIEVARAGLAEAWTSDDPVVSAIARSAAGRAHAEASRHCLQVCGGIGFTWEFALHHHVRRGNVLDALFGSWRRQRVELGQALLAQRDVPRVPALR